MLEARLELRLGELELRVDLAVGAGEVLALVGPNGAGKTTSLRALAGALRLDAGRIALDGRVLDEPRRGTFVPPEARAVGMVFQDRLLFPHLTALDNVAFGLEARGLARPAAHARAREALARVGADGLAGRRPVALSGGQAQRVALARALVLAPRLLLLDEPLGALDAGAREALRDELARQLAGFAGAAILVSHDADDAKALATHSLHIEAGRVES